MFLDPRSYIGFWKTSSERVGCGADYRYVGNSIAAAIRLRGEPIKHSPKVMAAVSDSIQLARMVMAENGETLNGKD